MGSEGQAVSGEVISSSVEKVSEEDHEEELPAVTVEGMKDGTAWYQVGARLITMFVSQKALIMYIGTGAFLLFNLRGVKDVFTASDLLIVFGIVAGHEAMTTITDVFKSRK